MHEKCNIPSNVKKLVEHTATDVDEFPVTVPTVVDAAVRVDANDVDKAAPVIVTACINEIVASAQDRSTYGYGCGRVSSDGCCS